MMKRFLTCCAMVLVTAGCLAAVGAAAADPWVVYAGSDGPGKGKQVVLVSGDEEYRSEETLTQLGRILARHHGFTCTVLFAINPADGTIDPLVLNNIPGLEALRSADLMIISTRWRNLPDEQMRNIVDYLAAGKPVIGLRTATHAFNIPRDREYYRLSSNAPGGGFGREILGETWIDHHGHHGAESTRGVIAPGMREHPILRGFADVWGPTDVYKVRLPLPGDSTPLVLGQVLQGMQPASPPLPGAKNDPMMPIAWTKTYRGGEGQVGRVFTTTMGAAADLASEGLRRLLVNAAYWCLGMEKQIPPRANVELVGRYQPSGFGFGKFVKGLKPADYALEPKRD
ncbi:MAG: ThuA domain-containing protein [Thermoguttaceae bacterium]